MVSLILISNLIRHYGYFQVQNPIFIQEIAGLERTTRDYSSGYL